MAEKQYTLSDNDRRILQDLVRSETHRFNTAGGRPQVDYLAPYAPPYTVLISLPDLALDSSSGIAPIFSVIGIEGYNFDSSWTNKQIYENITDSADVPLKGVRPSRSKPFAITQTSLYLNQSDRAICHGRTWARVLINDVNHQYATCIDDNYLMLQSADYGPAKIIQREGRTTTTILIDDPPGHPGAGLLSTDTTAYVTSPDGTFPANGWFALPFVATIGTEKVLAEFTEGLDTNFSIQRGILGTTAANYPRLTPIVYSGPQVEMCLIEIGHNPEPPVSAVIFVGAPSQPTARLFGEYFYDAFICIRKNGTFYIIPAEDPSCFPVFAIDLSKFHSGEDSARTLNVTSGFYIATRLPGPIEYGGSLFVAVADNTNDKPPSANWVTILEGISAGAGGYPIYNAGVTYELDDIVTSSGSKFVWTNVTPGNSAPPSGDWTNFTTPFPPYSVTRTYVSGDFVTQGGIGYIWISLVNGNSSPPSSDWQAIPVTDPPFNPTTGDGVLEWSGVNLYTAGSVVVIFRSIYYFNSLEQTGPFVSTGSPDPASRKFYSFIDPVIGVISNVQPGIVNAGGNGGDCFVQDLALQDTGVPLADIEATYGLDSCPYKIDGVFLGAYLTTIKYRGLPYPIYSIRSNQLYTDGSVDGTGDWVPSGGVTIGPGPTINVTDIDGGTFP